MFGEGYPYTNFHDLNLDWIIKEMKKIRQDEDSIAESATIATSARDEAVQAKDDAVVAKEEAQAILDVIHEIADDLQHNRIWGKQLAIYGDSYSAGNYGPYWQTVLNALTGTTAHVNARGSYSLPMIFNTLWDEYVADIYLINCGLNDVTLNTGCDTFCDDLVDFTYAIRQVNPNAEIYFMTPPNIKDNTMHNYTYPIEFYRQCMWKMSPRARYYNVIDGLKWLGLEFVDNVHPTATTAPLIGKYIFESLQHFGDSPNYLWDYSKLGRDDAKLLLIMEEGIPYIYSQDFVFDNIQYHSQGEDLSQLEMTTSQIRQTFLTYGEEGSEPSLIMYGYPTDPTSYIGYFPDANNDDSRTVPVGVQLQLFPNRWVWGF